MEEIHNRCDSIAGSTINVNIYTIWIVNDRQKWQHDTNGFEKPVVTAVDGKWAITKYFKSKVHELLNISLHCN